MLAAFALLLAFQCVGTALSFALNLPIPGPVTGMLLLFAALRIHPPLLDRLDPAATPLLGNLSLLFVPAGVGIVTTAGAVHGHLLAVIVATLVSTVLALVVAAFVTDRLMARQEPDA